MGAAKRSFLPSFSLTGSGGYAGSEFSELLNSGNLVWSIGGRIVQPIFQGGRLVAQVDIAEGQQSEALHSYVEAALNALAVASNPASRPPSRPVRTAPAKHDRSVSG